MPSDLFHLMILLPGFGLVVLRLGGMMLTAPLLSGTGLPARIKALVVVAMALAIFPIVRPQVPASLDLAGLAAGAVGELMIGMVIGLGLSITLVGMQLGGLMIGQQAGFALARVINPMFDESVPVMAQFFSLLMLVVFLILGGHRALVSGVLGTFARVPPLSVAMSDDVLDMLMSLMTGAFMVALKVAAPALLSLFLTSLALGFIARTVPQLNILSVGFIIRIGVAVVITAGALVAASNVFAGFLDMAMEGIDGLW